MRILCTVGKVTNKEMVVTTYKLKHKSDKETNKEEILLVKFEGEKVTKAKIKKLEANRGV